MKVVVNTQLQSGKPKSSKTFGSIDPIVKLAALVMVIDNEADENEMALFQSIPTKMTEHLEGRAGVNLVFSAGKAKTKNELDEESEHGRSGKQISEIANSTIATYNDMAEEQVKSWIESLAKEINGKWLRFHTLKLLVDMAAADGAIKEEELDLILIVTAVWSCMEDTLDFLFLSTGTEWEHKKGAFKNTKRK